MMTMTACPTFTRECVQLPATRFNEFKTFYKVYKKKLPKVDTVNNGLFLFCLLISVQKDNNTKSNNTLRNGQTHTHAKKNLP